MDSGQTDKVLLDAAGVAKAFASVVDSICAEFGTRSGNPPAFIGIQPRGLLFARRLVAAIKERTGEEPPVGSLDITMYRDDIGMRRSLPTIKETVIPFDINGRAIILADDVLQSGRTIRAALDAITDYGRPALIRLAVLIDRDMREYPIRADFAGRVLSVPKERRVKVRWSEIDGLDAICSVVKKPLKT
jgi:pyrimidine operon attenuation protein/uracil phosphoribosyltransferase